VTQSVSALGDTDLSDATDNGCVLKDDLREIFKFVYKVHSSEQTEF